MYLEILEVITFLLVTCETASEELCLNFAFSAKSTEARPAKGHEDGHGPGEPDVQREAAVTGPVQPEEKAKRRFYWCLQLPLGRIERRHQGSSQR